MDELKNIGVSRLGLRRFDMRYLSDVVEATEHIMGVVYGYADLETVALIATDYRIIFFNKKPLYISHDDISYDAVSGVSYSHAGIGTTITLHTRIKDFSIHTFNRKTAGKFVHFVEFHCIALNNAGRNND